MVSEQLLMKMNLGWWAFDHIIKVNILRPTEAQWVWMTVSVLDFWDTPPDKHMCSPHWVWSSFSLQNTNWSLQCKLVQTGHLLQREPRCDASSPAWPPKCTGCELILYSKEPRDSLEINKMAQDESGRHPKVCQCLRLTDRKVQQ